jgi:hypothetical protein
LQCQNGRDTDQLEPDAAICQKSMNSKKFVMFEPPFNEQARIGQVANFPKESGYGGFFV